MSKNTRPRQAPAEPQPTTVAHRLPDPMLEQLAPLLAERDRLNLAINHTVMGFLAARGHAYDPGWRLSEDGKALLVTQKPAGKSPDTDEEPG